MHLLRLARQRDKKGPNSSLRWMDMRLGKRDWHPNTSLKGLGMRLGKRNLNPDILLKGLGFRLGKRDWHPNTSLKGLGMRLGKRNLNPDTLLKGLGYRLGKRDGRDYEKHGSTPPLAFQATQYLPWSNVVGPWTKREGLKFVRLRRQMLSNVRL